MVGQSANKCSNSYLTLLKNIPKKQRILVTELDLNKTLSGTYKYINLSDMYNPTFRWCLLLDSLSPCYFDKTSNSRWWTKRWEAIGYWGGVSKKPEEKYYHNSSRQARNWLEIIIQNKELNKKLFLDIVCNDGKIKRDVATISSGVIRYKIPQMSKIKADIFDFCILPSPDQKFRVAYNIWKPFVFKR